MKITINFTTQSPLIVITPASAAKLTTDKRIVYGDSASGFPLTETSKQARLIDGKRVFVPVIPANTLRGALRRAAARLIEGRLIERGQSLSMAAFQGLEAGAVHGHPDGGDPTISQYRMESNDPYMGLFGGGPRMQRSRFALGDAIAQTRETHEDHENLPSARECCDYRFMRRADNVFGAEEIVDDPVESVNAWQTIFRTTAAEKSEAKASDEGVLRGLNALTAMEYVVTGVTLATHGHFSTIATHSQKGLWLLAILELCKNNQIGAAGRYDFGRFCADVVLTENGTSTKAIEYVDDVPSFTSELMANYGNALAAARTYLEGIESETIESLFASSAPATEALMAKCKTPAAKAALELILGVKEKSSKKGKK